MLAPTTTHTVTYAFRPEFPDQPAREAILKAAAYHYTLSRDVDLGLIAYATQGFNEADLVKLCRLAGCLYGCRPVHMSDFEVALDYMQPS